MSRRVQFIVEAESDDSASVLLADVRDTLNTHAVHVYTVTNMRGTDRADRWEGWFPV